MPSMVTHAAVGVAAAAAFAPRSISGYFLPASVLCATIQDLDVIGFYFHLPHGHILGHRGFQTVFIPLFDLTAKLAKTKNLYSLIDFYAKVPILCLDELGYVLPSKEQADALFQIISKRTEVATTLVTTNLVPSDWGKIFDAVTATAILDRLSMNGRFITFEGRSYRRKKL